MLNKTYTTPSSSKVINPKYSKKNNNQVYETTTQCSCNNRYTILKGCVILENGVPINGAIILLESMNDCDNCREIYSATTNIYGEFCFIIYNINIDYKLKIFNNEETCKLNLYE